MELILSGLVSTPNICHSVGHQKKSPITKRRKLQKAFAISRKQASSGGEVLISDILDKSLLPRTLRLVLSELDIQFCMCVSIELRVSRSPISLPLIGIIEPAFRQFQNCCSRSRKCLLEASVRVGGSSRADDVGRCGFAHTKIQKGCHSGRVKYITSVDECLTPMISEFLEA